MSSIAIVVTKLKATTSVTTLVPKASIYPIMFPQGASAPAILVNLAGGRDRELIGGAGQYYSSRVNLEILDTDPSNVDALGKAVIAALGDVVKQTVAGCVDVDIAYDGGDFTDWADDRSMARWTIPFRVDWKPAP